jgi:hypothetical protein
MAEGVLQRFDASLEQFIIDVVKKAEATPGDRYKASFAGGKSGLSFGAFQNDVAANGDAKRAFEDILLAAGLSQKQIEPIVDLAKMPSITREKFAAAGYLDVVERAFNSDYGRKRIDKRDQDQKDAVLSGMRTFLGAVRDGKGQRGAGVFDRPLSDPEFRQAVALVAAWINRSGPPTDILKFVKGGKAYFTWTKNGKKVISEREMPHDGPITLKDLKYYFSGTKQFSKVGNGEDFDAWFTRITKELPPLRPPEPANGNEGASPKAEALDKPPTIDIPDAAETPINSGTDDPLDGERRTEDPDADQDDVIAGGNGDDILYGGSGDDRLKAEADRLMASDDYYRDGDKQARVAAIFTELYPPDAEPDAAAATTTEGPFEPAPTVLDTEAEEALQAEANTLIASADYWRDPHKQRRVAAIFKRLYPGPMRTAPLDFGEGV